MSIDLETLIRESSKSISEKMADISEWANTEEDVRYECNKLIDSFIQETNLKIRGRHEYGLAGGNIDSKYGGVVIEYKKSGTLSRSASHAGVKSVTKQIVGRFKDFEAVENISPERIFGIGCDANFFVFVRQRGGRLEIEKPADTSPRTVERMLRAIVSLGARGFSYTSENLHQHFGSASPVAKSGIKQIYGTILTTLNIKALTFFKQWQILFGEVCGYDVKNTNTKIRSLGAHYGIDNPQASHLLFSLHTYYAIFIKLLAAEIVSSFAPVGLSPLKRLVGASTDEKLREELLNLEQGGIWAQLGIRNFLEGDLFSWYLDAWDPDFAESIRGMVRELDLFDPSTLAVDPLESRDLLKQLYQQLFPQSVRHDLGEYYTPDWLAEFLLDKLDYDGNPRRRILDPTCGSGTFLVQAINRAKAWFEKKRHTCGYGETELLELISRNIIGFDLNPLAVMAARTNYLLALRDLLRYAKGPELELPVYLCDSLITPSEYRDLFKGGKGTNRRLRTSVDDFIIPNEIAENREIIGRYADTIEFCIRNAYKADEFIDRCRSASIPTEEVDLHRELYSQIQRLDAANKNGIWARIIKNAFAPLFIGSVDIVAGNPPWINWENLPEDYRDSMKPLWQKYGLFTLSGHESRLGGGKKDLAMLFVYGAADNYLRTGGRLGFIITQTVFKTKGAGEGFRLFKFQRDNVMVYLNPISVHDLSQSQVFEGATNRAAILILEKKKRDFSYPVPYTKWYGPSRIGQAATWSEVQEPIRMAEFGAIPVNSHQKNSPWLTAPRDALAGIKKVLGKSDYQASAGCTTWLNGVYWVSVLEKRPNGEVLIENLFDVGKIKVRHVQAVIEENLVYPLLRGRDVQRWKAEPSAFIILAQDPNTRTGILEVEMKAKYPKTYAYLKLFEGDPKKPERGTLRGRSGYRQYFRPTDPFYSMYNVGPYTMAKWKIAWREQSQFFQSSVIGYFSERPIIPDHKLMIVQFDNEQEAYFVSGLLNSSPSILSISSYALSLATSTHVFRKYPRSRFLFKK